MLAKRIIPCLDVKDGEVVKGVQFRNHERMGSILDLALRYRDEGADELVFYDISASPEGRDVEVKWVSSVARILDIPFTVAGGISSTERAAEILSAGADKISVNSPALRDPELINRLADRFGRQCVVVGIDSHAFDGKWKVHWMTGDPDKSSNTGRGTLDWVREVQQRGAGEIVLNCMKEDGRRAGYDIKQLKAVREICHVPLVASGGAGSIQHFVDVFAKTNVDAALAASVFHKKIIAMGDLKQVLAQQDIEVRS